MSTVRPVLSKYSLKMSFYFALLLTSLFWRNAMACQLTLKVSLNEDWSPYVVNSGEEFNGLEIEILNLIFKRVDFCAKYIVLPSSTRAFKELIEDRLDLILGASFTEERASFANFSERYRDEEMLLFRATNQPLLDFSINTPFFELDPLLFKNTRIAVNRGSKFGGEFDAFIKQYANQIAETTLSRQRFDLLKIGRVDYAVEDRLTGYALMSEAGYAGQIVSTGIVVHKNPIFYMLRPGVLTTAKMNIFNQSIIDSQPQIEQLINSYILKYIANKPSKSSPE